MSAKAGAPIRFENVTVRYPDTERDAVAGVSLEIAGGEFVVLLGPSGCGKSTLLRTVNRLIVPQSGRVLVDGTDNADIDPIALRRSIGYVIQAVGLFSHMTIAQNIGVVPTLLQWDRARIQARVAELLGLVSLPESYASRRPRELSGGEQQRAGVARAIAAEPRVLLMDEPFGAVDAIVRASLQMETKRIARVLETTIVFVTHDVDEALALADRIVVMRDGAIVQSGTPLDILTQPKTAFVEELLDTRDVVRRLQLLCASDVMRPYSPSGASSAQIDASATLRESLNGFLLGATELVVTRDGSPAGLLTFADVQHAIGRQPQ